MNELPEDRAFLDAYDPGDWPRPSVTVDLVVFTVIDTDLKVLLIRRGQKPFEGHWALPGGFVRVGPDRSDQGESLDAAAARELASETNITGGEAWLEQLYTFGAPGRDPRMRVISVAYYALVQPRYARIKPGDDAAHVEWMSVAHERPDALAFDHDQVLDVAIERIRGKIDYSDIAFQLVNDTFTVAELRGVHEAIKGEVYDPGNFRRRFNRMMTDGIIEEAPGKRQTVRRPAKVYRFRRG